MRAIGVLILVDQDVAKALLVRRSAGGMLGQQRAPAARAGPSNVTALCARSAPSRSVYTSAAARLSGSCASRAYSAGGNSEFIASEIAPWIALGVQSRGGDPLGRPSPASRAERVVFVVDGEARVIAPRGRAIARSIRAPTAWNVPSHMPSGWPPSSVATRSRISPAALLVNVTARMCAGSTPRSCDQLRDPQGQHPGLARSRARQHQERPVTVLHRLPLRRVEESNSADARAGATVARPSR